jgi:hypothetical protein
MKNVIFIVLILTGSIFVYGQSGSSTGEAKTYTTRRTSGVVSEKAEMVFEDITSQTALEKFNCTAGNEGKEYILETTSCTVAIIDFDNDGKPDIYLLNGSTINAENGKEKKPKSALFRNLGNWKFEDVTEKSGVANERWGMGVSVGDYNNDGFSDIFVSNFGVSRLYKNNGNGTFTDVASQVGLDIRGWHTGSSFGDFNKDGLLDLFVPAYLAFDLSSLPQSPKEIGKNGKTGSNYCQFRGQPVMCGPRGLKGAKDKLFQQTTDGKFIEVGDKVGVTDEEKYYGFSSVFVDIDEDNDLDLLVVNDSTPKQLYLNDGKGKFEEIGYPSGIALNENGREQAGMGVAVGDYDNDGLVDFHITNFSDDSNTLYRNDGEGNFTDITFQAGLGESSIPFLGWGTSFIDFDNDGWKDVLVANGHVYPVVDKYQWGTSFAQQILLFQNNKKDDKSNIINFQRVPAAPNSGLALSLKSRGLAIADFDGDGKTDVIINNMDSKPTLLKNVSSNNNNWLKIKLIGKENSTTPLNPTGSKVFVTAGGVKQRFDLISGSGYASQNEQTILVGLGQNTKIESLEINWVNGEKEFFKVEKLNQMILIKQGTGNTK